MLTFRPTGSTLSDSDLINDKLTNEGYYKRFDNAPAAD